MLLMVFMFSYGVASQALVDPYRLFDLPTLVDIGKKVSFLPYWQTYGELSLDE